MAFSFELCQFYDLFNWGWFWVFIVESFDLLCEVIIFKFSEDAVLLIFELLLIVYVLSTNDPDEEKRKRVAIRKRRSSILTFMYIYPENSGKPIPFGIDVRGLSPEELENIIRVINAYELTNLDWDSSPDAFEKMMKENEGVRDYVHRVSEAHGTE